MRITLQMRTDNAIYNINRSYARVNELNNQLASGYRVTKPSDDPTAAYTALRYELMVNECTTYKSNITTGDMLLGQTDNALDSVDEVLTKAKAVATAAANGTNSQSLLEGYVTEMQAYLTSLVSLANTTSTGQYLFGGTATSSAPYTSVGDYVLFSGNEQAIQVETATGIFTTVNVSGSEAFGNLETKTDSATLNRLLNLSAANSTRLEDLNSGQGVQGSTLTVCWSAATEGLNVDISSADTLADVAVLIEQASAAQAATYDPTDPRSNYTLRVQLNDTKTGLEIVQWNTTSGSPVDLGTDTSSSAIKIRDTLAGEELGLISSSSVLHTGTTAGSSTLSGYALQPAVTSTTLLSDLDNWDDSTYIVYNGDEPDTTIIKDLEGADSYCANWNLNGVAKEQNISSDGDLYYEIVVDATAGTSTMNVYNDPDMTAASLVATGVSDSSLILLQETNNSGINGSVQVAPPSAAGTYTGELQITFDAPSTAAIATKAFEPDGIPIAGLGGITTDGLTSNWELHGLAEGVVPNSTTGTTGNEMYIETVCDNVTPAYTVNVYLDAAHTTLVATGTSATATGTVNLQGVPGYDSLSGQVDISCPASLNGTYDSTLTATFKTVGDFTEAINSASIYVNAAISDDGTSLELSSRLCGAYLRVSQDYNNAVVSGDTGEQLVQLDLQGVAAGINSDKNGNLFAVVTTSGTGADYTVNLYSDSDCNDLVATGTTTSGTGMLVLTEANDSGLSGSVFLQYSGFDDSIEISAKGRSVTNDEYDQLSQIDVIGLTEGITSDYANNVYAETTFDGTNYTINLYADSTHKKLVATGSSLVANGTVNLTQVGGSGVSGSIYLNYSQDDSDIVIIPGTTELSGQEREDNIFSLFADAIDAMKKGDVAEISDLLDDFSTNLDRLVNVRAQIGSTQNLLELFESRHSANVNIYKTIITAAVSTDVTTTTTEYASAKTTYEAALSVSANAMSTNLFNYI